MELLAITNNRDYKINVSPIRDDAEQRLYFLVELQGNTFLLAEKTIPKGHWQKIGGDPIAIDVQHAIYDVIDRTSIKKLFDNELSIDKLSDHYFNHRFNRN